MNDAEKLIREALAAGPTPGPWHHDSDPVKNDPLHRVRFRVTAKGRTITQTYYSSAQPGAPFTSGEADNRFIAACSPENIAALLAEIDRLTRERDEARARCIGETRALVTQREDLASRAAQYMQERDEARAERDALRAACKTTLMLRQLGGMMPGTKAVIDVAIHHAEEALAQIEKERSDA